MSPDDCDRRSVVFSLIAHDGRIALTGDCFEKLDN